MSTSLETSPNPSRWNKADCIRALRGFDRALGVAGIVALLVCAGLYARKAATPPAFKTVDAAYDTAMPGDVVNWCVDRFGETSYLAGKPSQPLLWANEAPDTHGPTTGGRCQHMYARVESRERAGLKLTFLGTP